MNVLELYKGKSYFGNHIKCDLRNHLITVDENNPATHQINIKSFLDNIVKREIYKVNYFHLIICYIPNNINNDELGCVFEILKYYNTKYILIDNSCKSLYKYILNNERQYIKHQICDVCRYGFTYYRELVFFMNNNIVLKRCMKQCGNIKKCPYLEYGNTHICATPKIVEIPPRVINDILTLI